LKQEVEPQTLLYDSLLAEEKEYWLDKLSLVKEPSNIRLDRPRLSHDTNRAGEVALLLSEETSEKLVQLTNGRPFLLYAALMSALAICLQKYTGNSAIVVGSPSRVQEADEYQGRGWLPIIARLDEAQSFRMMLLQVRQTLQEAYARQHYFCEHLMDGAELERRQQNHTLFDIALTLQGLHTDIADVDSDIIINFLQVDSKLTGNIAYKQELYQEQSIRLFALHLVQLLKNALNSIDAPISQLSMMTAEELQLLERWNATRQPDQPTTSLRCLFESQVLCRPEAVAAVCDDHHLTYQELNRRTNQLAHYLQKSGVGPDICVGLCAERSLEQIIGLLGILKAGGAYVPLDVSYPLERLTFLANDIPLKLFLLQEQYMHIFCEIEAKTICLDADWQSIACESGENPCCEATDSNLAYVIYTSGSTGRPKGVLVAHAGLSNLAVSQAAAFGVHPDSHVLQFASLNFDASISEIAMALVAGATLYVCPQDALRLGAELITVLQRYAISTITLPPTALAVLPAEALPALQTIIAAGEACSEELVKRWSRNRQFFNAYGPTEGTVCATLTLCQPGDGRPPIGRALANVQVYVLDKYMHPVPIGIAGEAYIGGIGVARGYLHQPGLTAERFVPHPYALEPGERLYKTGDLVRYLPDGNLEYLDREDYQVKVRGYRIEPGEIETVLGQHPEVKECVVVVREDSPGDKRLIAYVTARSPLMGTELRAFVQKYLPAYMVPTTVLVLDSLPLKPNGKIDREALPRPEEVRSQPIKTVSVPRTTLEQFLVELWQDLLEIEPIGLDDSFFELGGESITAAVLINKLQEKLGVPIYVVTIFDAPTIAQLVKHLCEHYPEAIEQTFGLQLEYSENLSTTQSATVTEENVVQLRKLIPPLKPYAASSEAKNAKAIFVLSPPRSGSTLLRVMLGGHPELFAPPELELLSFNTLQERLAAFSGRNSFWLEGTIRAIMELKGCGAEEAKRIMAACEEQQMTTKQFYQLLQSWIGTRQLVDKTPAYALDMEILRRAEQDFADVRYIHLIRHPYGMIRSFEEARSELGFFRYEHPFSTRQLAELIWIICQQNIQEFLRSIPAQRQYQLRFEELVENPKAVLEGMCQFLELDFHPDMLEPYKKGRMTDGIHPLAKMLGDVKFHTYQGIEASVATRWKEAYATDFLGDITWEIAASLGYERPEKGQEAPEEKSETVQKRALTPIEVHPLTVGRESPLSFAQERLWFLDQLIPNGSFYNIPNAGRLSGVLVVEALERSLREVVRRHSILRTTFQVREGQPVQVIGEADSFFLPVADLSALSPDRRAMEARRLAQQEADAPFDLARGPLLRSLLLRSDRQEHVLLQTLHHIISDGWSSRILVREVTTLYNAFVAGKSSPLPPLAIQYSDFALWQRQWLSGEILDGHIRYWVKQLETLVPLELPIDCPRPATQTFQGARLSFQVSAALAEGLKRLSQNAGTTLFMTLLSAFQVLLARYTGQRYVTVGTPIAGRTRAEIETLIGFFLNTLVLHTNLSGNPSFLEVLARVREVCLGAYAHQDMPFEKLVEILQPERDLSRSPLFQVMFNLQTVQQADEEQTGFTWSPLGEEEERQGAKYELTLSVVETTTGLHGSLEYNTDLFHADTANRLLDHFLALLEYVSVHPEQRLEDLPLLHEQEVRQILLDWNATDTAYPEDAGLHQFFEAQVRQTPDRIALLCGEEQITYRELNKRSNQLARFLHRAGVGPEIPVGVFMGRSLGTVIGLLGIFKAGGVYIPLDPAYPRERLSFMVENARVSIVLTTRQLREQVPGHPAHVICLDSDWDAIAHEREENFSSTAGADNLAYVIYTSGSTGQPKGVAVPQRQLINRFTWMWQAYPFADYEMGCQKTTVSFVDSIWELLGPLLQGVPTVIVPDEQVRDIYALVHALASYHVTRLWVVPSLLRALLDLYSDLRERLPALKVCVTSGEALVLELWQRFCQQMPQCMLLNLYGTSEVFDATHYDATLLQPDLWRVPIGRPINNVQVYLLDAQQRVVPVGVTAEMYVGGDGLARGYLHQSDRTAERFVPHPFSNVPGARLYRTGDLARYLPEGTIEYLGRSDHEVKIRGHRIDLGEVEAVLRMHPAVHEAVVAVREDTPDDKILVAYVVPEQAEVSPTAKSEIRGYLAAHLPGYMLPSFFVYLDKLPLTPNGKVDRRALFSPGLFTVEREQGLVLPGTPVEELVASIWAQVLRRAGSDISIHDDFFALGGHSLLATQVISRIRATLQVNLPVRSLFEKPTIARLAQEIEEARWREQQILPLQPLQLADRTKDLPLSFALQRLWFLDQFEPNSANYNIHNARRLRGALHVAALEGSVREIVRRHEVLRTTFQQKEGQPVQVIGTGKECGLRLFDLEALSPAHRERVAHQLVQQEAARPFDLQRGPLLRCSLLRLGEQEHVLLVSMHHIVSDGWSMGILIGELTTLYSALSEGRPSPLPDLPVQYADYALWQRQWLQGEVLTSQLDYWKQQLNGIEPLQLPTDRPRPAIQTSHGAEESILLADPLAENLKMLSRSEGVTLFMTLLASLQVLLARYSGQEDIAVGTLVAHRTRPEIEGLIGFFINTLVLRGDLSGNPAFRQLLAQVREVALDAYAHQDVPFEQVVEAVQPNRDLSRSPLFQVMLVLQNVPRSNESFKGLEIQNIEGNDATAIHDLFFTVVDTRRGLDCTLRYNTDLFEQSTILQLLRHWQILLEGITAKPDLNIAFLPLLTGEERQQLLVAWNNTYVAYPLHASFDALFRQQARRRSTAIAVVCETEVLTYGDLDLRVSKLAQRLRASGVGSDVPVGIYLERSIDLIVAIIAIWRAGGAYVPLDPAYPAQRLAFILHDTQIRLVITQPSLTATLPAGITALCCRDTQAEEFAGADNETTPQFAASGQSLAYIIYTSGSTGKPKGVMVQQAGMLNHLFAKIQTLGLDERDIVAQTASPCFDISVWQCLAGLLCGAQVHVFADEVVRDPQRLLAEIADARVSILEVVPSLLQALLVEAMNKEAYELWLRWLVATAEVLPSSLCRRWYQRYPHIPLVNAYGPTECSDDVAQYVVIPSQVEQGVNIPIGQALANTQLYILDSYLMPVPVGVVGEIYVGGAGVGRGYYHDAARTAENFVPDLYGSQSGARLYRTGDMGRYLANAAIEFVGRRDLQVKVRGYRIELGEIEEVLRGYAEIAECAVVSVEKKGERILVAYIVLRPDSKFSLQDLYQYIGTLLPAYMLPSSYIILEKLPRTLNGKVNRRALSKPDQFEAREVALPEVKRELLPGHNEAGISSNFSQMEGSSLLETIKEMLLVIWKQVLGREELGVYDNFFDMGGHSLLATQVISGVRSTLQVEVPLRSLFELPTIAQFADHVEMLLRSGQGVEKPPLQRASRTDELPLSFAQQRLWLLDQLFPESLAYIVPSSVRLRGALNVAALEGSVREIVRRHEVLRTTFQQKEGQPVQVIGTGKECGLRLFDLEALSPSHREHVAHQLVQQEAARPFDLQRGPLLRCSLLRLGEQEHVLLVSMHHIVSDGWSMGILIGELTTLYSALSEGRPSTLPDLPVQYADYALWQRQWLQGEVLKSHVDYWTRQLRGARPLQLPTDRPRPQRQSLKGASYFFSLPTPLCEELAALSYQEGVTLFMTVLAAFQVLLSRLTGQNDVLIGTDIANRVQSETEQLIGFFVNLLALRSDLSDAPSFRELLHRVREMLLGAYTHQELPFEMLVDILGVERSLDRTPLIQVLFVFQNVPVSSSTLPSLEVDVFEKELTTAKFDMAIFLQETSEGMQGMVNYATDLFNEQTIVLLIERFHVVLRRLVTQPDVHVNEVEIYTDREKMQIEQEKKEQRRARLQGLSSNRREEVQ
jgi:amino acid adenylation domain-containing protein